MTLTIDQQTDFETARDILHLKAVKYRDEAWDAEKSANPCAAYIAFCNASYSAFFELSSKLKPTDTDVIAKILDRSAL